MYESLKDLTCAAFLQDPNVDTPVFVRFSTVVGSRGSADTVRDVRGFATKFYTTAGNFDLVGNNMPVFFIQDGIKFPDLVHAVKPEPHHEMPAAASAHDTFWDFMSLMPESAHMVMWLMSDRAIPRSYRMMEGFGVHTFRFVNAAQESKLVKFHWKPILGVHSLVWDEALKIAGVDPDFHRRDLWETLDAGTPVEFELGLQIVSEKDAQSIGVDLLDPTKLIPEEAVPVRPVGKMTLDTQLTRLGSPNFADIPVNRPMVPVANFQQDGSMRRQILTTRANYSPNSIAGGCPMHASADFGAFIHFPEPVQGSKGRERSPTFADHYSQAALFWASMTPPEQRHIVDALSFELGKVVRAEIKERVIKVLANINNKLVAAVAKNIGLDAPPFVETSPQVKPSAALSQLASPKTSVRTRQIACLCAPGVDAVLVQTLGKALQEAGAKLILVSATTPRLASDGSLVAAHTLATAKSVLFDAVYLPDTLQGIGSHSASQAARTFIEEAYQHSKAIGAQGKAVGYLAQILSDLPRAGVITSDVKDADPFATGFIKAVAKHRHWEREGGALG